MIEEIEAPFVVSEAHESLADLEAQHCSACRHMVQRVRLDCQYGIGSQKPCMVWFLGPLLEVLLSSACRSLTTMVTVLSAHVVGLHPSWG